jgi:hypothetical protein
MQQMKMSFKKMQVRKKEELTEIPLKETWSLLRSPC